MGRVVAAVVAALPILAIGYLQIRPEANPELLLPSEHFYIVTLVSAMAAIVALLVARAAVQMEQFQVLLVALGFTCLAGFFSVHALATPGILIRTPLNAVGGAPATSGGYGSDYGGYAPAPTPSAYGATDGYGAAPAAGAAHPHSAAGFSYDGTIVGLSAFLSLFAASFFFAASYTPWALAIKRRTRASGGALLAVVVAAVVGYAFFSVWQSDWIASWPLSRAPYSYMLAAISVGLLLFAAGHYGRLYLRTGFPMQGALVLAFVLLAEAQVTMIATRFWTLAWWGYHLLMLAAVVLAMAALFLELDRRRGLERFLPTEVVERVVAGDALRLAGERRRVTVMFADLRDSTALAEQLDAEAVVGLLNAYVGQMAHCVFAHGGMLDKFLGDGLMAIFGVLDHADDGATAAVRAARQMREELEAVNRRRGTRVRFGVGIHTGPVVLGAIGIPQRSDFTAIGDTVNTAARLQELTKQYDREIVLSRQTAERLPSDEMRLEELGSSAIRGRKEPIELYSVG